MQLHNGNSLTVKPLATETADITSLLARVNGQAGNDSTEPAVTVVYESRRTGNGTTTKPRRATGPQMKGDENLAVKRARTALLLVKALGITIADAVTRTNSNSAYVRALELIEQSGDAALARAVDEGAIAPLPAAKMVKQLAKMKTGFKAASLMERTTFFGLTEVRAAAMKAVSAEELLRAAITAFGGVDETLNALAAMSEMKAMVA
jgi:hypothetical protein